MTLKTKVEVVSGPAGARAEVATVTFYGQPYTATGSVIDHEAGYVTAYVQAPTGELRRHDRYDLTTFKGAKIGTATVQSTWTVRMRHGPVRWLSLRADIDGCAYHGRVCIDDQQVCHFKKVL